MAKLLNWALLAKKIRSAGLTVFTPQEALQVTGSTEISIRFLLTRAVKRGDCLKLRRGLYALAEFLPNELEVANALYRPSYISFAFALSYYHLIPETVYTIASVTTRTTATFTALEKQYVYHRLKPQVFTGYQMALMQQRRVAIADPEKALVDALYYVVLHKWDMPERLQTHRLSKSKAKALAKLFDQPDLEQLVEKIL